MIIIRVVWLCLARFDQGSGSRGWFGVKRGVMAWFLTCQVVGVGEDMCVWSVAVDISDKWECMG
jgi:hypothetical protein